MQPSGLDRPPRRRRLWVTRAEPGASETAARLRALGLEPEVFPLLRVEPATGGAFDLEGLQSLAFTSANGVRAFGQLSPRRDFSVFAVGPATAAAAKAAGFAQVTAGDGDGRALAERIAALSPAGEIGVAAPDLPAFDLAGALQAKGLTARRLILYRTEMATDVPPALRRALAAQAIDGVLLHSPRAAEALAGLDLAAPIIADLELFALSEACAAPVRGLGWRRLQVARSPQDAELLKLIS